MDREKSKIKILFVSDFTFTHTIGGTEVATARLINGVASTGEYEVHLFAGRPHAGTMAICPDPTIHIHRFPYFSVPGDKGFNNFIVANPWRIWKLLREIRPDLVHFHIPSPFDWLTLLMVRTLCIPAVYTSHMFSEHFFPEVRNILQKIARRLIDSILSVYMRSFDLVIHPSEIQRLTVEKLYGLSGGVVISNGFVSFGEDVQVNRPADWSKKTVFLSVSRLSYEKNIRVIIDAFDVVSSECNNTMLVIVGDGVLRGELEAYAATKWSSEHIQFMGQQRGNDLARYYKMADVFVAASSRESEGLTVLEAISFEKPVIISDASGNAAKQFLDGNGFLFRDHDQYDLADKMRRFLKDPDLIVSLGSKSPMVADLYRFESSLQKFREVYDWLILSPVHPCKNS